jgi:hypothetical protein
MMRVVPFEFARSPARSRRRQGTTVELGRWGALAALLLVVWLTVPLLLHSTVEFSRVDSADNFDLVPVHRETGDRAFWGAELGQEWPRATSTEVPAVVEEWGRVLPGEPIADYCVAGNRITVPIARPTGERAVVALDRRTGRLLWQVDGFPRNELSAGTGSTLELAMPADDGNHVFVISKGGDEQWLSVIDASGRIAWRLELGSAPETAPRPPVLSGNLVLVVGRTTGLLRSAATLTGVHRQTGAMIYRRVHPVCRDVAPPIVRETGGRPQVVLAGAEGVAAWHPDLGKPLWHCGWESWGSLPAITADEKRVYLSVDRPQAQTLAIRTNGRGNVGETHVAWRNPTTGSTLGRPALMAGHLVVLDRSGAVVGMSHSTGLIRWRLSLPGKPTSGLQCLGDQLLVATDEPMWSLVRLIDGTTPDFRPLGPVAAPTGPVTTTRDELLTTTGRQLTMVSMPTATVSADAASGAERR